MPGRTWCVGCTGGGSNFAGIAFPFIGHGLRGGQKSRIVAVEPAACPSLTRGKYAYDFGDTGRMTPLTKMHTLGSQFTPPGFHAGGLRYHGMAPLVSHFKELGLLEAVAYNQVECFEAGVLFARNEGIVPAPEANHAVKGAIEEALRCKREGKAETILFNLCGHGHFDMTAYQKYFAGELSDEQYDENELAMALAGLPSVPSRLMRARTAAWVCKKVKLPRSRRLLAVGDRGTMTSSRRFRPPVSMLTLAYSRTFGFAR